MNATPEPQPQGSAPLPGRRTTAVLGAVALTAGLVGGGLGAVVVHRVDPARSSTCDIAALTSAALPAVVTVYAQGATGAGSGSGAITTADGTIITNDHVIAPDGRPGRLSVQLNSGEIKDATLVGTDPKTDLAVLKIDGTRLPTLAIGDDTGLRVGQQVVALGAPLGLSGTVTAGIVSALNRDIMAPMGANGTTVLAGSIQTDASINPGNSGGPLIDCTGRLVGVNTAISTVPDATGVAGGGSVGIGFAVPATTVRRITSELAEKGRATHPSFGLVLTEIPPVAAAAFGTQGGLYVQSVSPGGAGASAGVQASDIITSVAGGPATLFTVTRLLATAGVGDTVQLGLVRAGQNLTVSVVLAEAA